MEYYVKGYIMAKVFCKNCKYLNRVVGFYGSFCICEQAKKDTWFSHDGIYEKPWYKNASNDCPDYKPKWWIRLLLYVKGKQK